MVSVQAKYSFIRFQTSLTHVTF